MVKQRSMRRIRSNNAAAWKKTKSITRFRGHQAARHEVGRSSRVQEIEKTKQPSIMKNRSHSLYSSSGKFLLNHRLDTPYSVSKKQTASAI